MKKLKILFAAAEVFPFIKTGGLGDVAYSLPRALIKKGHDVRVILPKYSQINFEKSGEPTFIISVNLYHEIFNIYKLNYNGINFFFVENMAFFERETVYENSDKDYQFAIFSEIILLLLKEVNFHPDIIHCNDWHTGVLPYFLNKKAEYDEFYYKIKTIYTIHNLKFQGIFGTGSFEFLDYPLPGEKLNFMRLGIQNADIINTVSETYRDEILTEYFGQGLDAELRNRENDLFGIINGIDYELFNPQTDKNIYANFTTENLDNKVINKRNLQTEFGMELNDNVPIIASVSRLTDQKGFDLIETVIEELFETSEFQLLILGKGEQKYEEFLIRLKNKYPSRVGLKIGYDEYLANKIYASSDILLMPSLFEPCGLSQLISIRYGTVPLVRETGGLNDTVLSYRYDTDEGNGFSFKEYNAYDMLYTIRRALSIFYDDKKTWKKLIARGMNSDFSWNHSAIEYEKLYINALKKEKL